MLVVAAVFSGQERGDQRRRDLFDLRVGSVLAGEVGEQGAVVGVDPGDPGRELLVGADLAHVGQLGRVVLIGAAAEQEQADQADHAQDDVITKEPAK